jgi:RNA polymerase sigma-70 factor (ECF subfamily)
MEAMTDEFSRNARGQAERDPQGEHRFVRLARDEWKRIFRDLAAGETRALERLYHIASSRVFGLALWRTGSREDACDVVQDVFVRVAERRDRLAGVRDPKAWLLSVAHRMAVDAVRRRERRRSEPLESCAFLQAPGEDAARGLDAGRASALLAKLPPAQREVIYLHHYAGCTYASIGRIVGVPTFTAASRYRIGLARLRRLMEGLG